MRAMRKKNYSVADDVGLGCRLRRADERPACRPRSAACASTRRSARLFPQYSRNRLQAWLKSGHITVDGRRLHANGPSPAAKRVALQPPRVPDAAAPQAQRMPLKIVFEDAALIVIDKPAGLVVHPGAGQPDRTLLNALLAHAPALAARAARRHRASPRQGHQRPAGGGEDRRGAGRPGEAARRAQHAPRLSRGGAGRPAGERRDRRAGRPRRARAHAHGGHAARQARRAPTTGCSSATAMPRWSNAASRPAARTRSACTSSTCATRWSATRPIGAARATASLSPARRCTPSSSRWCIRGGKPMTLVGAAAARHEAPDRGPAQVIEPDWPAPPRVHALVTTRDFGDLADEAVRRKLRRCFRASRCGCSRCMASGWSIWNASGEGEADAALTRKPGTRVRGESRRLHAGAVHRRRRHDGGRGACRLARPGRRGARSDGEGDGRSAAEASSRGSARRSGPHVYEVGEEVRARFLGLPASAFVPTRPGHWLLDLYAVAREKLTGT